MVGLTSGAVVVATVIGFLSTLGREDKSIAYTKYIEMNKKAPPSRESAEYDFYFRYM